MKPNHLSKAKRSSLDIISNLPENIIETILCLVPIKDAVRTSVLSREWRYKWNQIPKLVFNEKDMFDESTDKDQEEDEDEEEDDDEEDEDEDEDEEEDDDDEDGEEEEEEEEEEDTERKYKLFYAIHQVLLNHRGSILEFTLSMKNSDSKCVDIDQIITYLSRKNTVKRFTLELNGYDDPYKLPLSEFSSQQLTDLYLQQCHLYHQQSVNGFGSLTSLFLNNVLTTAKMVLHLVSKSPLLKRFSLVITDLNYTFNRDSMCEVFGYLSAIEHLHLAIRYFSLYEFKSALPELPTPLVHLKYAHLLDSCFVGECGLSFAVFLIRCSPNLEKLKLQSSKTCYKKSEIDSLTVKEYADIWLENLKELKLDFAHKIPDLEFVKLILAKSPVLKKVNILVNNTTDNDIETEMLSVLSRIPRASQAIELIFERVSDPQSPSDDED